MADSINIYDVKSIIEILKSTRYAKQIVGTYLF